MFIPITKVDEVKREVWGIAAEEAPDKSGEIMDYASSKPNFAAWSQSIFDASMGKSLGNVRAMHGKVAAGKVIAIEFDDAAKNIPVGVKIVDDNEWKKIAEGIYTGFSVGGDYGKTWRDGTLTRYEARPAELSLADNPCMYGATFQVVKANGASELRKFVGNSVDKVAAREDVNPDQGKSTYGDVKFADEKNKKYPIDTAEHIRAAWNYINKPDNSGKYSAEDVKTIKDRIIAAWKDKIDKAGPPAAQKVDSGDLVKAGARHSATDNALIQEMHDKSVALGAMCPGGSAEKMAKMDTMGDSEDDPADEAMWHGFELSNIADVLSMLARVAAAMADTDPEAAQTLLNAAKIVTEALASKVDTTTAAMADAQAEDAAEDAAEGESMEMAVKATLEKLLPDMLSKQVSTALNNTPLAKADGLSKLEQSLSDIAARLGALDSRVSKVEQPGSGPVLRDVTPMDNRTATNDPTAILRKMIAEEVQPAMRQMLMTKLTEYEISRVQQSGGNPVR